MARWVKWSIALLVVAAGVFVLIGVDVRPHVEYVPETTTEVGDPVPLPPPDAYGLPMSGYTLREGNVRSGATFGDLLSAQGVPATVVNELVERAKGLFDVRKLRAGYPYAFIFPENGDLPAYFIYEPDAVEYVVFNLQADSLAVTVGQRPVETTEHGITCTVTGALYNDLADAGADPALAVILSEVFAWTVDFYRIQKGDVFSVVYSERTVEGERVGLPQVLAARYTSAGKVLEAFGFEQDSKAATYFDAQGNSLRKAFLKAPLKFSRITSGFSSRRLHPVQKVFKAHLGTDYAAAYGTPIMTVGDGVVEKAGRTGGNGNYVKVRHNGTYSTQYLHMRKILVREGQRVRQGDVIGEVGSTGLATGPHVCFRFWKNGVQVDPRKEVFPSSEPVPADQREAFNAVRDSLMLRLDEAELAAANGKVVNF
jgi:murein DD-endopeptidase MepM/ murein hydrolase activator NlpD